MPLQLRGENSDLVPSNQVPLYIQEYIMRTGGNLDDIDNLTVKQVKDLDNVLRRIKLGIHSSTVQICGDNCPTKKRCPLAILNKEPDGYDCPLELDLFEEQTNFYMNSIQNKLNIDAKTLENDQIIMSLIGELVECDIQEYRMNTVLAEEGMLDDVPTLSIDGGYVTRSEEHQALKIKREIKRRRDINLKQLIATPEMVQRLKAKKDNGSLIDKIAETREKARLLAKDVIMEAQVITNGDNKRSNPSTSSAQKRISNKT